MNDASLSHHNSNLQQMTANNHANQLNNYPHNLQPSQFDSSYAMCGFNYNNQHQYNPPQQQVEYRSEQQVRYGQPQPINPPRQQQVRYGHQRQLSFAKQQCILQKQKQYHPQTHHRHHNFAQNCQSVNGALETIQQQRGLFGCL